MKHTFNYSDDHQSAISFPLGGIGSGCIGLAGNGHLNDWEIFNRPAKGRYNGLTHFAIKVEDSEQVLDARILQGDQLPPFTGEMGRPSFYEGFGWGPLRETLAGMPHFRSNTFNGTYPIAKIEFDDPQFPGLVSVEAFNPLIPHQPDNSSIPAAFFSYEVTNDQDRPLDYYITGVVGNPYTGRTRNRFIHQQGNSSLTLDSVDRDPDDVASGDLCLATDAEDVSYQEYLYRGEWFDALEVYWKDTLHKGPFIQRTYEPADRTIRDHALMSAHIRLEPGESRTVRFVLSWNHPNNKNTWGRMTAGRSTDYTEEELTWMSKSWKNYYAVLWEDSLDSSSYALRNWDTLYAGTKAYTDMLFASTLPDAALDAVSANVSILKSPTVWRLEDGTLYGWEGVGVSEGSCEGSCTHVWGYAQVLPFLFPSLARGMREAEYRYNWAEDGSLTFRLMLPMGAPRWHFRPAVDGQMATVMKTYREWKICGDDAWLKKLWPRVKASVAFAWSADNVDQWDPERSGVISGRQHHTLDMELFGANAWLSGMYLGALKAAAEMAEALADRQAAEEFSMVFSRGVEILNTRLFNGEYFIQDIDLSDRGILDPYASKDQYNLVNEGGSLYDVYYSDEHQELKYQMGQGVALDQMLGQWHADIYGLGSIFEEEKCKTALRSIYKYNFREHMRDSYNPCRIYCLNDEAGIVICSWPEGVERPAIPVPYSQETMHGFEYAAADLMIRRGLYEEGLSIVSGIRDRYDGYKRNPWNEIECGSNYARSMASYALLLTFSGFSYDARTHHISFDPIPSGDCSFLWSFSTGWGGVSRIEEDWTITVTGGGLKLKTLGLPCSSDDVTVELNSELVHSYIESGKISFSDTLKLESGDVLTIVSK
ncbi:MAG: hypothetical protein K9M84_03330 [Spirochaetia bacterium]|nr:hypothetical protein [Spirochaetia bacterium]